MSEPYDEKPAPDIEIRGGDAPADFIPHDYLGYPATPVDWSDEDEDDE